MEGKNNLPSSEDSEALERIVAENEHLRLRILAMENLISVAEKELGLSIKDGSLKKKSSKAKKRR